MSEFNILVINPKNKSTQIALYEDYKLVFLTKIMHSEEELKSFRKVTDQTEYRMNAIVKELKDHDIQFDNFKLVIGRGGLIKPVNSGVYEVNAKMREDLIHSPIGEDVVNLGGLIAYCIAQKFPPVKPLIVDPMVVDEFEEIARVSGHPAFKRKSVFHALSQKTVANVYAKSISKDYKDLNLIIAHLGNGTTIGAHRKGKVIDVTQGFDGSGPFSAVRSGSLPIGDVIRMCFSGKYTQEDMMSMITSKGGLLAHLGTDDIQEVERRIENNDKKAKLIFDAMAYQISKYIGFMFAALSAETDAIIITGDMAYSNKLVNLIIERVNKMAPVFVYPGDDELRAMANCGVQVLKEEVEIKEYK